jgi:putative membrane protein
MEDVVKRYFSNLIGIAALAVAAPSIAAAVSPAGYVAKAGASDLYERTSSQAVLQSTKDPAIRDFANMMVADHSKSTDMVKAAAAKSGLKPKPPVLEPKQKQMIDALNAASGTARDKLYVTQQKKAHQEALALHKSYSVSGSAAALKTAAGEIVPVVQHHISMLNNIK